MFFSSEVVSPELAENVITKLLQNIDNTRCADCSTENVECASVYHGTFVCSRCGENQKRLGPDICKIKYFEENWEIPDLKLLVSGGNVAFKDFFSYYNILDVPFEQKYRTRAAYFYREVLSVLADGFDYEGDYPTLEEGIEIYEEIDLGETSYESTEETLGKKFKWKWLSDLYEKYPKLSKSGIDTINKSVEKIKKFTKVDRFVLTARRSFNSISSDRVRNEASKVLKDIEKYFNKGGEIAGGYMKMINSCGRSKDAVEFELNNNK